MFFTVRDGLHEPVKAPRKKAPDKRESLYHTEFFRSQKVYFKVGLAAM